MTAGEEQAILEQLENLDTAKKAIRQAIAEKYVTVSDETPFVNYADAIKMIGSGIGGTYGKSKVAMPLPPEGNYGGGVNEKLAWKKNQVNTLITAETDYPEQPTFTITSQQDFQAWCDNDLSSTGDHEKYKVVCIKPLMTSGDNPTVTQYLAKKTIYLSTTGTNTVFGMNGASIKWKSTFEGNLTATSSGQRFLFVGDSSEKKIYNLEIQLEDEYSRISNQISLLRGLQIISAGDSTHKYGDLFQRYSSLSRCYIESWGYRNKIIDVTLTNPDTHDLRSGLGNVFAAEGQVSDVTIINRSTTIRGCVGIGSSSSTSPKLLRCYVLGPFDEGIELGGTSETTVDRCFVQLVYLAKGTADSYGIRASKIINSTIQHVDCKINQATNADSKSNYGFYGTQSVVGCKLVNITGAAIIGIFANSKIIDSAVVNYTLSGIISGSNNVNVVLKSGLDISGCAIYEVNSAGCGSANDIKFKIIQGGPASGELKNNHIGHVFLDFNAFGATDNDEISDNIISPAVSGAVQTNVISNLNGGSSTNPTTTSASANSLVINNKAGVRAAALQNLLWQNKTLSLELVTGAQQHQNNRIDSIYIEVGSYKLAKTTIFSAAGVINNNYVGSFDLTADYKDFYTFELFALAYSKEGGSITNNVFDQINVEAGRRIGGKFFCFANAKIVQNNRVSSFKLRDSGKKFVELTAVATVSACNAYAQTWSAYQGTTSSSYYQYTRVQVPQRTATYNVKIDPTKTANYKSLIGVLITLDQTTVEANSFGLLFVEKKQYDLVANTTVIGILNDVPTTANNVRATIKNNYFKNISALGTKGTPVEAYASLFANEDHLTAFGIYLKGGALVHTIDNNELNVECFIKQNAARDATGYAVADGAAFGIYINNKYHVIKNNTISIKGLAKKLMCIENSATTTAKDIEGIPSSDCENNIISLENLSAVNQSDTMIRNIHRLKNTKLREGKYNTITEKGNIYKDSWNTAVSKEEQVIDHVEINPDTNEEVPVYKTVTTIADAVRAGDTTEGGNNELPLYYHVYALAA